MKTLLPFLTCVALFFVLALSPEAPLLDDEKGKAVFLEQSCDRCHAVPAAGLLAKPKTEEDHGPALNNLGAQYNVKKLRRFFKRPEVEDDRAGAPHTKPFKGTDEELQALVDWLLEHKSE